MGTGTGAAAHAGRRAGEVSGSRGVLELFLLRALLQETLCNGFYGFLLSVQRAFGPWRALAGFDLESILWK